MRLCRFDGEHLGVWLGDKIADVSAALDDLPQFRWARGMGDPVVENLTVLRPQIDKLMPAARRISPETVTLEAPVAMPSKIIGAPVNYHSHVDEAQTDYGLHQGRKVFPIDEIGCFLKAGSSLCGHGSVIVPPASAERVDYEAEIAIIIGRPAKEVKAAEAMPHVAGYALAFDMTVRGKQDRSMRKSCDGFAVVGPALVTADEIDDPSAIAFELRVNGEIRQAADTGLLIRSIPELIEMCSAFYTLLPGDVIMTGTPAGVAPVAAGDHLDLVSPQLGRLEISIG